MTELTNQITNKRLELIKLTSELADLERLETTIDSINIKPFVEKSKQSHHLIKQKSLIDVLNYELDGQHLPVLYVLYGSESNIVKVGKTIDSHKRIESYLRTRGKYQKNYFYTNEEIVLLGLYVLPKYNYRHDNDAKSFMATVENILINNAEKLFGKAIYGREWFRGNNISYVAGLVKSQLFKGITDFVENGVSSQSDMHECNIKNGDNTIRDMVRSSDIVHQYAEHLDDNLMLDDEKLLKPMLYQHFQEFEKQVGTSAANRLSERSFGKRLSVVLADFDYVTGKAPEKVVGKSLSHLQVNKSRWKSIYGIDVPTGYVRYYQKDKSIITDDEITAFEKLLESDADIDVYDAKNMRLLAYFAYERLNSKAQSLIETDF